MFRSYEHLQEQIYTSEIDSWAPRAVIVVSIIPLMQLLCDYSVVQYLPLLRTGWYDGKRLVRLLRVLVVGMVHRYISIFYTSSP
jgi:hypothetical protein